MKSCSPVVIVLRYLLAVVLTSLVACQSPQNSPKRAVPQATSSIEWWPLCDAPTQLPTRLSSLTAFDTCLPLASFQNKAWVLRGSAQTFDVSAHVISPSDWREGQRPPRFYHLESVSDVTPMLTRGLKQLEHVGVLLQGAAWSSLEADRNSLYDALTPVEALQGGNTVVHFNAASAPVSPVVRYSAGYHVEDCSVALPTSRLLSPPPHKAGHLGFVVELSPDVDVSNVRIVKHWVSLDGRVHKRQWPITRTTSLVAPCIRINDTDFNPVLSSVWHLESLNQWATSPIWYTPLKG